MDWRISSEYSNKQEKEHVQTRFIGRPARTGRCRNCWRSINRTGLRRDSYAGRTRLRRDVQWQGLDRLAWPGRFLVGQRWHDRRLGNEADLQADLPGLHGDAFRGRL